MKKNLLYLFVFFLSIPVFAQDFVIIGEVIDDMDEPLIGAAIIYKGTTKGEITDNDGRYFITVKNRSVNDIIQLEYSFLGMKSVVKEIKLTSEKIVLNVTLTADNSISEAIVQGYGRAQNKETLIGSAFQVNSEALKNKPLSRIDNILDGLVPGMSIASNTDSPTTPYTRYETRIRGEASLSASNEPLWIVDDVPIYTGNRTNQVPGMSYTVSPLSFINAEDIQSITVLKDASQVAIYGADGANGVILVTTKSGSAGLNRQDISANVRYGITTLDNSTRYKVMNAEQYLNYAKEAWVNGGNDIKIFPYQDNPNNAYSTTDTDWYNEYYGIGSNLSASLSINQSTKKTTSFTSVSFFDDNSTVLGNEQQRISARLNNNYKLSDKLNLKTILSASYNTTNIFPLSHEYYEVLPIFSPYDMDGYTYRLYNTSVSGIESGNLKWEETKFFDNSISERELNKNTQKGFIADGNIELGYEIIKGLKATTQFGVSYLNNHEQIYYSRNTLSGMNSDGTPSGYSRRASANYLTWTNVDRLNFNRDFGQHNVSALLGLELSSRSYNTLNATGSGFINDSSQEVGYSESDSRGGYSSSSTTRKLSYFGQASYFFDRRYGFQANFRREGNSSFGSYSRWANYFSLGGTWNLDKEEFYNLEKINRMKVKASFGTSGNSRVDSSQMRGIGTFTYGDTYSYDGAIGGVVSTAANPGISWEKTYMSNIGLDLEILNRFSFAIETYYNYTTNLLSKVYISRLIGEDRIYANVGEISNLGAELTLDFINIQNSNFKWTTNFNLAHNRNRVEKLSDGKPISYGSTISAEGYDVSSFYLVRWAGVDPTTGEPMWYDKDGNLTYSYSSSDRVIDKSSSPVVFGGLSNTFTYLDFSLSFQLNYSIGGYALSSLAMRGLSDGYDIINQNCSINSLDYWKKPGDVAANPAISTVSSSSGMTSTRFLYNKTNIRLQHLTLSYSIPDRIVEKANLSACRVSLIGDNLYLFTPDQKRGLNSYKTMMNGYPVERTISLSLDVSF